MSSRWREWLVLIAGAVLMAAAGWTAAGGSRRAPPPAQVRTLGGCATDSECEAAEEAAAEAVAFERAEARARREFAAKCVTGQVPCRWRK